MSTETEVKTRTLSWLEFAQRAWGKDWKKQEVVYEFTNREFTEPDVRGPYDPDNF